MSQFNSPTVSNSSKSNINQSNLSSDNDSNSLDVEKIIKNYLFQRGYTFGFSKPESNVKTLKEIEDHLLSLNEHDFDTIPNQFSFFKNESEENYIVALNYSNGQYEDSFKNLKIWANSLSEDIKEEMEKVLFPLFVAYFLDQIIHDNIENAITFLKQFSSDFKQNHQREITLLSTITSSIQARQMPFLQQFEHSKYKINISLKLYIVLFSYIEDNSLYLEFHIVSRYISFQIDRKLPNDPSLIKKGLYSKSTATNNFSNIRTIDKIIEDKANSIKRPATEEIQDINIIKKRINSIDLSMPSICCYTFKNSDDGICHLNINSDASILIASFSNSVMRIWKNINSPTQRGRGTYKSVYDSYPYSFYEDFEYMRNKAKNSSIKLVGHSGPVFGTAFSENNEYLLSVSQDKIVRLWDLKKNQNIVNYYGHNYPVWDVEFSPYDMYFATASNDKTARLWKSDHIYPLRIFAGHFSDVNTIKFHPNVNYLATGSEDSSSRFWDVQTGKCVRLFKGHKGPIYSIAISPDGKILATGSDDKTIKIWDIGSGNCIKTFVGHNDIIYSLDFNENGKILASGSCDNTVRLWDIDNLRQKVDNTETSNINTKQNIEIKSSISTLLKEPNPLRVPKDGDKRASKEMINLYLTKSSPIYRVRYTERNLLYALCEYRPERKYINDIKDNEESSPISTPISVNSKIKTKI